MSSDKDLARFKQTRRCRAAAIIGACIHVLVGRLPTPKGLFMKKTYPLHAEGKHPDRVLEAVKHDIRKYFKRERNRPVPVGADFWDFDCKVGASAETAETVRVGAVIEAVDATAKAGAASVYVEILSKYGVWVAAPEKAETAPSDATGEGAATDNGDA